MNHPSTLHRAAVITESVVYYGNGTGVPAAHGICRDIPAVLSGTLHRFAPHSTIVIDGVELDELALTVHRADGWQFSGEVGAWMLFHRDNGARTVAIGVRSAMIPARHFGVLFDAHTDPGTLALLLDRFIRLTGHSWRGTPATTAHAGIRLTWANSGQQPLWNQSKKGPGRALGALSWSRPLTEREQSWGWVHTFDSHAAYLGAAMTANLAWSGLEHTGPRAFDKRVPGYWLLQLTPVILDWPNDGRPPLFGPGQIIDHNTVWVTTPYAELLAELGDPIHVIDSWTGATHGRGGRTGAFRVLRPWAETLREARAELGTVSDSLRGPISTAIKRLYKDAVGGMQRPGMRISRPDWGHTIIDLWRANMFRRMIKVHATQGVWPVAVETDSLSYADGADRPQPRGATLHYGPWALTLTDALNTSTCAVGCGCADGREPGPLGTTRHESTVTADQWTRAHTRPEKAPRAARTPRQRTRETVGAR